MKKIFIPTEYKFYRNKMKCLKENLLYCKEEFKKDIIMMRKKRKYNNL